MENEKFLEDEQTKTDSPQDTYIMELGENGPLKLGESQDVEQRRKDFQTANYGYVKILKRIPAPSIEANLLKLTQQFQGCGSETRHRDCLPLLYEYIGSPQELNSKGQINLNCKTILKTRFDVARVLSQSPSTQIFSAQEMTSLLSRINFPNRNRRIAENFGIIIRFLGICDIHTTKIRFMIRSERNGMLLRNLAYFVEKLALKKSCCVDYNQLNQDLLEWNASDHHVQSKWLNSYLNGKK